jgi:hypothetical protein
MARMALNRAIIGLVERPVLNIDIRSLSSPACEEAIRGLRSSMRSSIDDANRFADELRQLAQRSGEFIDELANLMRERT